MTDPTTPSAAKWQAVPKEPTREMWAAGADVFVNRARTSMHHDKVIALVWAAMLAAAPEPAP